MSVFSNEVQEELKEMIVQTIQEELPYIVREAIREQLYPQGYIKSDTARKLLGNIAPQTLEQLCSKGLPQYKLTKPNLTYYKVEDINRFMKQYEI